MSAFLKKKNRNGCFFKKRKTEMAAFLKKKNRNGLLTGCVMKGLF